MSVTKKIKIFDTAAGKVVDLVVQKKDEFSMYYCGPTVYNYVHLGNMRPVVVFDIFSRLLKEVGYSIKVVSNYTDIDDKIINEALKEGKTEKELTDFYIKAYEDCLDKLNLMPLFDHPRVSNWMTRIGDFIKVLMNNGFAYQVGGDVYFRVGNVADYGSLSKTVLENNQAGSRIDVNTNKENPGDFALWKVTDDQGIKFDSPFGKGRPGWHTECVVMIKSVFNQPMVDVHGGGFDLKFPHHENERAQSIAYDGTPLAKYWMHVGFLTAAGGVKMSKSLGNVVLAKDFLAKYSGNVMRLFFYQSHYRAPIAFSEEAIQKALNDEAKYRSTIQKLNYRLQRYYPNFQTTLDDDIVNKFVDCLSDDLNIANAITVLEGEIKGALSLLRRPIPDEAQLSKVFGTLLKLYDLLGLKFDLPKLTDEDLELLKKYDKARKQKDFATSDILRKELMDKNLL